MKANHAQIRALLTPEQQQKFDAMPRPGRGPRRWNGPGGESSALLRRQRPASASSSCRRQHLNRKTFGDALPRAIKTRRGAFRPAAV